MKYLFGLAVAVLVNTFVVSFVLPSSAQARQADGPLTCPVKGRPPTTSGYGQRQGRLHAGIDLGMSNHTPMYASVSGTSSAKTNAGGYGYYIDITSTDGSILVRYGHMEAAGRVSGRVAAGQFIGYSNNTGSSSGPHLHWELHVPASGSSVNPAGFWNACTQPSGNPTSGGGGGGGGTTTDCGNHPTISQSNTGGNGCVKHLQGHLNKFGYNLSVDGAWGTNTNNAVRSFQGNRGSKVDGIVGPETWGGLHSSGTPSSSKPPTGHVDRYSCNDIAGWAFDQDNTSAGIQVHIYFNAPAGSGGIGFTAQSNTFRSDVNNAYGISGTHGFTWATPKQFKDGAYHSVYVYAIDSQGGNNPQIGSGSISGCR